MDGTKQIEQKCQMCKQCVRSIKCYLIILYMYIIKVKHKIVCKIYSEVIYLFFYLN